MEKERVQVERTCELEQEAAEASGDGAAVRLQAEELSEGHALAVFEVDLRITGLQGGSGGQ